MLNILINVINYFHTNEVKIWTKHLHLIRNIIIYNLIIILKIVSKVILNKLIE